MENFRNTNIDQFQSSSSAVNTRSLVATVFLWMFAALGLTTITSLSFHFIPSLSLLMYNVDPATGIITSISMFGHIIAFAPLVMILGASAMYKRMSYVALVAFFLSFSAVLGISLSFIFSAYQIGSIVTAFLSASALFGTMAVVGYFTNTDLTKLGSILFVGMIGIVLASVINYFAGSERVSYIISILAVIIFTGLTAYDMQTIRRIAAESDGSEPFKKMAIWGALNLYIDFINLFMALLRIFGRRN